MTDHLDTPADERPTERHPALTDAWRSVANAGDIADKREAFQVVALAVGGLVDAGEIDKDDAVDELTALGNAHDFLRGDEVEHVVGQAMLGIRAITHTATNGHDPGADFQSTQETGTNKPEQELPSLPFINMSNWDHEPRPETDWVVHNRIPRHQTALFSGEGGTGKSTLWLQECAAHVLARDWLGSMPEPGPAIFLDAEDGESVIHARLYDIAAHYNVKFADLIKGGLHLMSFAGRDAVLATVSRSGKIEPTALYGQLLEAARDIKPVMFGIASSANVFAGNESDRTQVQQFAGLITRLAMVGNGAAALISHPSLTGITTGTGISGTTQWHNAMRARLYMKGVKEESREQPDNDLREIVFKKNQYGRTSENIVVQYRNGLFLPVAGTSSLDQAAQNAKADDVFLDLLRRFTAENRTVSAKPSRSYAPSVFAKEDEALQAKVTGKALEAAMRRLFKAKMIENEPHGYASRPSFHIVAKG